MNSAPFPSDTLRLQTLALLREHIISQSIMDGNRLDAFIIAKLLKPGRCSPATTGRRADEGREPLSGIFEVGRQMWTPY